MLGIDGVAEQGPPVAVIVLDIVPGVQQVPQPWQVLLLDREMSSSARPGARFDMTSPANQRKLQVVDQLSKLAGDAGMTLIELAIAFVINHPAVTAAIIGPRTMEQLESQFPAADVTLTADILDQIDQLVAPGVTINPDDNSYGEAELNPRGTAPQLLTSSGGVPPAAPSSGI